MSPSGGMRGYIEYLGEPRAVSLEAGLLLLVCAAEWSNPSRPLWAPVSLALLAAGLALASRRPRWMSWSFLLLTVSLATAQRIYVEALALDSHSDRDECAEAAARAFLAGKDPWGQLMANGNPITTGPVDTLALAPVVALFGRIDEAALAFWLVVLGILAWGDGVRRNGTFEALALLCVAGPFGIAHTQRWSLDELFFPIPLFVLGWAAASRGRWMLVGALLAATVLWRVDYVLPAAGFLAWMSWKPRPWRQACLIASGAASVAVLVCAPFVLMGASLFAARGPFATAATNGLRTVPDLSIVHGILEAWSVALPPRHELALKLAAALLVLAVAVRFLRDLRLTHPFWHVAVAGLVAHSVIWRPTEAPDYLLMFVLPGVFAIAWSSRKVLVDADAPR